MPKVCIKDELESELAPKQKAQPGSGFDFEFSDTKNVTGCLSTWPWLLALALASLSSSFS